MCRMKMSSKCQPLCLIDHIYPENGLINSTLAECSILMVFHHYALIHILAAIGYRIMSLVKKFEARAVRVATTLN